MIATLARVFSKFEKSQFRVVCVCSYFFKLFIFSQFLSYKLTKIVTVGLGSIGLGQDGLLFLKNYVAGPKITMNIYFDFFPIFLKIL